MTHFTVAHSPDPDDAFMYYGLAKGFIPFLNYNIQHRITDIHTLNQLALQGTDEVTAISAAAYPSVAKHYRIMTVGASVGRGYGPIVVASRPMDLTGKKIAVPGKTTTARLLSHLLLPSFQEVEVPFDQIFTAIHSGSVDAGVLIHEGQLTYRDYGMVKLVDLTERWQEQTGFSVVPLGLDVISRKLTEAVAVSFTEALAESILYAYEHLEEAARYAQQFGRGIDEQLNKEFVKMYVNADTLYLGEECQLSLKMLYSQAHAKGLLDHSPSLDFIAPQHDEVIRKIANFIKSSSQS